VVLSENERRVMEAFTEAARRADPSGMLAYDELLATTKLRPERLDRGLAQLRERGWLLISAVARPRGQALCVLDDAGRSWVDATVHRHGVEHTGPSGRLEKAGPTKPRRGPGAGPMPPTAPRHASN
jgi:hypothetical protein